MRASARKSLRFSHVALENWRNFQHVDVSLQRRVFLVGPNASGKSNLLQGLKGFRQASEFSPWLVLVDLDREPCAAAFVRSHLPQPGNGMCFRVAVREIEAWLLADAERLSAFPGIARSLIPSDPERLDDPKTVLVNLARQSRRAAIRQDMVPRPGSGRNVGPAYTSRLIEFVELPDGWRPDVAAQHAESLHRCLRCLRRLVENNR